jgi:hypothetical protein
MKQVNGYKVVMTLPDGRQVRLRYAQGPNVGRSLVFPSGDDAMDAVTNARECFPACQIRLYPTADVPNVVLPPAE